MLSEAVFEILTLNYSVAGKQQDLFFFGTLQDGIQFKRSVRFLVPGRGHAKDVPLLSVLLGLYFS